MIVAVAVPSSPDPDTEPVRIVPNRGSDATEASAGRYMIPERRDGILPTILLFLIIIPPSDSSFHQAASRTETLDRPELLSD